MLAMATCRPGEFLGGLLHHKELDHIPLLILVPAFHPNTTLKAGAYLAYVFLKALE